MKKTIVYSLFLFTFLSSQIKGQNLVSFFEEHIDFTLDSDYFVINGIYSFHNKSDREINQQILFPFANKTTTIDSIRIINLNTKRKVQFNRLEKSVQFSFSLPANDTVDVNIFYRQKKSDLNKYIITSTQSWGKSLKTAVYTLTTEQELKIKSLSYQPDTVKNINDKKLYLWYKTEFMPQKDFEIVLNE